MLVTVVAAYTAFAALSTAGLAIAVTGRLPKGPTTRDRTSRRPRPRLPR